MSDLQKRADKYINSETADVIAMGIIVELRAHLRASNRSAERNGSFAQQQLKARWALEERIAVVEKKLDIDTTPPKKEEVETPDDEGWIQHDGGECPVDGDAVVDVRTRVATTQGMAHTFCWPNLENEREYGDIVEYRIVKEPTEEKESET